jgi:hypothetical protein
MLAATRIENGFFYACKRFWLKKIFTGRVGCFTPLAPYLQKSWPARLPPKILALRPNLDGIRHHLNNRQLTWTTPPMVQLRMVKKGLNNVVEQAAFLSCRQPCPRGGTAWGHASRTYDPCANTPAPFIATP